MQAEAFQFLRMHSHGASAAHGLLAEADRVPSHCSHIKRPRPARWLMDSPEEVHVELESFTSRPQPVRPKSGGLRYRKVRSDLRCFMDCVASYPVEVEDFRHASDSDKLILKEWVDKTHHFIQAEFGSNYIACCFHLDESHPHFHFYIVGNASRLHPGLRAEFVDGRRIKDDKERKRLHINGLKAFLDRYYEQVSCQFGHSRGDHRRSERRILKRDDYRKWKVLLERSKEPIETELPSDPVVSQRLK